MWRKKVFETGVLKKGFKRLELPVEPIKEENWTWLGEEGVWVLVDQISELNHGAVGVGWRSG